MSIFETKEDPSRSRWRIILCCYLGKRPGRIRKSLFPFCRLCLRNKSALNSFMHFSRFMNEEWKPIPSSIIAEGLDIWNGAGDRGDAAMIAYGASRYALASGKPDEADKLWPLIEWCLTYCNRNLNKEGWFFLIRMS